MWNKHKSKYDMTFSTIEKEVIVLSAILEMINSMVNYDVLDLTGVDPDSEIKLKSSTHQKYFNIILVDFLSRSNMGVYQEKKLYIDAIQEICKNPSFNEKKSIDNLKLASEEFSNWLKEEVKVPKTWFPSISIEEELSIKRSEFLEICGNISKHNFSKLSRTAHKLSDIFIRNKIQIKPEDALLALDDFYERFHVDIFNYHVSTICEFMNNIRWGIYEYLQPELSRSKVWGDGEFPIYTYTYPYDVKNAVAKVHYWDLMNMISDIPYMKKFKVTQWLKKRY